MFKKILIANRGEIACRVMRTAKRLGIKTVAVYSDADEGALHVRMADEAVRLGPPPAAESYLLADEIIRICKETGAGAVHPGYGFLSEQAKFAKALEDAGLVFIGPPASAIAAMGDKIASKKLAQKAGVNIVPGYVGEIADTDQAAEIAKEIGYPVMVKASAGGGGKGMRVIKDEKDLRENFDAIRREAKGAFGDDRVFIEKFIVEPHHIEIQLLGDKFGNVVYLNERDCSVQRRNQKVIEEAPSPFATPEMRKAMGEQAVMLAKNVGYYSAGTVEFVVGADHNFHFMEMNTRLQVEHGITEYITGLDLVEEMLKVANGEKLSFAQKDVQLIGHAVETRFYAEDPYRGFLPVIGRISEYQPPVEENSVRIDTGVEEGSEISIYYDPMIAKLITHAPTREEAIDKQIAALNRYYVRGITHNADFLAAVMKHPRFRSGKNVTTAFIKEEYPEGFHGAPLSEEEKPLLLALCAVIGHAARIRARGVEGRVNGHLGSGHDYVVELDGSQYPLHLKSEGNHETVAINGTDYPVEVAGVIPLKGVVEGKVGGRTVALQIDREGSGFRIHHSGMQGFMRLLAPRTAELARYMLPKVPPDLSRFLLCPMPGLVVSIKVAEGDHVEAGQPLATVEAMKMENILRAEKAAIVSKVCAKPGDSLAVDDVILEFATES